MSEKPLVVSLKVIDQRTGQYTLSFDSSQYPVTLNLNSIMFSEWLRRLRPVLMGGRDPAADIDPQEDLLRNVGIWLWKALLPESAPAQEREALAQALRTGHIPLLLDLPDTLTGLPWELLHDPEQPDETGFLAVHLPLVRLSPKAVQVVPMGLPLRVLLLISSPPSLGENSRVDVESERAAVEQAIYAMREAGFLHLLVEDIVTLKQVEHHLDRFKPHIVHYVGHGEYDQTNGGTLFWEDDHGNVLPLEASRLATLLRSRNLHAVVLHGCETAKGNAEVQSLAGSLVQEGLPAVLAMQASFTYESSQLASRAWYQALVAGQSMASTLLAARQALIKAGRPDWAVPILQASIASLIPLLDTTSLPGSPDPLLTRVGAAADVAPPIDAFVGRHRELRALHLMLEDMSDTAPVLALITGPGGMGKSTLVAQAVTRYGGSYKAALLLRCQEYQSIDLFLQSIGAFLKRLGAPLFLEYILPDPKRSTEAKIDEAVVALNTVGPVLLVIDNLESVQDKEQLVSDKGLLYLLQTLLTNLHGGRVLITSRSVVKELLLQESFRTRLLHLSLEDLSHYETSQLLLRYPSLAELSEIVRQMLVREFGGIPYVYDLLSSQAAAQDLEQIIYEVREYGTIKQKMITEDRKQRTAEEWQKVYSSVVEFAALEVIVSRLSQGSRTLLAQLGVLHQPFPLAAIEEGLKAERSVWRPLLDWSLLYYDPQEKRYHLHSLTRRYVEDMLDEQPLKQAQVQLAAWYEHYARQYSHDLTDILEAHRLRRAASQMQQAGQLVIELAATLRRFGLYSFLRNLFAQTLSDIQASDKGLMASILLLSGIIAEDEGEYEQARDFCQRSLDIFERLGDQSGSAGALYQLGNLAFLQGEYEQARDFCQRSLDIFERLGDQSGRALSLYQLGFLTYSQGEYEQARGLYQQSLDISERLGNQSERAHPLCQLGVIAQMQGEYEQSRDLYQRSLDIFERLGDLSGRAAALSQLGNLAYLQEKYEQARDLYQQSLDIREQLGDLSGRAVVLYQLGDIARMQGEYEQAHDFYQQSLDISERLGEPSGSAKSLVKLGILAYLQREYERARDLYQQGLDIFERLGDQSGCADTLHQLGMIAGAQEMYEEAYDFYQQSLKIREQLGDLRGCARSLYQLGMIAQDQEMYEEARDFYQQSLKIKEQLGDQSGCARSLYQLGMIAEAQGEYKQARDLYQQSLDIFERLGDQSGRVRSLRQLGMIAEAQGEYKQARDLYQQSLDICKRMGNQDGQASSLYQLGALAYEQEDFEQALRYTIRAYIIFDALQSPSRALAEDIIQKILEHVDTETFITHWRTLAGNRPSPIEDTWQRLQQVISDFIQARTWNESRRILEAHPELLLPEMDVLLQAFAEHQEQDDSRRIVEEHRLLLAQCRDKGIDTAFAQIQRSQSPEDTFATDINRLCNEVVATLRTGNEKQREALATRIEQMLKSDFPMEGVKDFLVVLFGWLRGQDTQVLVEKLPSSFREAYAQMIAVVKQEERGDAREDDVPTVEQLPSVVSSIILHGMAEQRQRFAANLLEQQQQLPPEAATLGRFLGCLAAALRGEPPEAALLEPPFTQLWQEFQEHIRVPPNESSQEEEEKHD